MSDDDVYERNNFDSDLDSVEYNMHTTDDEPEYANFSNTYNKIDNPRMALTNCAREFMQMHDRTSYTPISDGNSMEEVAVVGTSPTMAIGGGGDDGTSPLQALQYYEKLQHDQTFINARMITMAMVGESCCGKSTWRELINLEQHQQQQQTDASPYMRVVFEQYVPTIGTDLAIYNCWSVNLHSADSLVERIRSPLVPPPHWNDSTQAKYVPYHLQMWEIGGNRRFDLWASSFFPKAAIILIMLDATNKQSLITFTNWLKEIDLYCKQFIDCLTIVVCLNKTHTNTTAMGQLPIVITKQAVMAHLETWPRSRAIAQVHYFETDFVQRPGDAARLFRFITRDVIEPKLLNIGRNKTTTTTQQSPLAQKPTQPSLMEITDEVDETARKKCQCKVCTIV